MKGELPIATDTIVRRWIMGSTTDKASGVANQAAGKVKEAAGKATGSEKLQAEGLGQRRRATLKNSPAMRLRTQPRRSPMPRTKNSELSRNDCCWGGD